ncbi:hypothetical protein F4861DRAFT_523659 [Xylaria intraflava]|nr:hypothetical protein F4861DRAFT_523659 [Xylaria intraflava]
MCPHRPYFIDCRYGTCRSEACRVCGTFVADSYGTDLSASRSYSISGDPIPSPAQELPGHQLAPDRTPTAPSQHATGEPPAASLRLTPESTITNPPSWDNQSGLLLSSTSASSTPAQLTDDANLSTPYKCEYCSWTGDLRKDLNWYRVTMHRAPGEPLFRCRCGHENSRKDNYERHLRRCERTLIHPYYMCKCGDENEVKEEHEEHIRRCRLPTYSPRTEAPVSERV